MKTYLFATAVLVSLTSPLALAEQKFSQSYAIKDVSCVHASRAVSIELTQGAESQLTATANENTLPRVSVEQKGDCLVLGLERGKRRFFGVFNDDGHVGFNLQLSQPELIKLTGASRAVIDDLDVAQLTLDLGGASSATLGAVAAEQVHVRLSGASRVAINTVVTQNLTAGLSGASKLQIDGKGTANTVEVNLSGASKYFGEAVAAVNAKAHASGASHVTLNARDNLEVHASGASYVGYSGSPRIDQHSSGSSTIRAE